MLDNDDLAPLIDQKALAEFRQRALNPDKPVARGMAENPDVFFQHRESSNTYYNNVPAIVEEYMAEISKITGRKYGLFDYYGAEVAENVNVFIAMLQDIMRDLPQLVVDEDTLLEMLTFVRNESNIEIYRLFS